MTLTYLGPTVSDGDLIVPAAPETAPPTGDAVLLESGDAVLLESGDLLLMED